MESKVSQMGGDPSPGNDSFYLAATALALTLALTTAAAVAAAAALALAAASALAAAAVATSAPAAASALTSPGGYQEWASVPAGTEPCPEVALRARLARLLAA